MKTSNKIIIIYLSVVIALSVVCLCDNALKAKSMESAAIDLLDGISNQRLHVVNMVKPKDERPGKSRLFYRNKGSTYLSLGFVPTQDRIYLKSDTLTILSREYFFIVFPYPLSAYEDGEPYPVYKYVP